MDLKRYYYALALLVLSSIFPCTAFAVDPPPCTTSATDAPQIVDAVKTMFAAASKDDFALFHSVTTSDFYAYDGGRRFDGDALMSLIKTAHDSGTVFVWSVNDPEVHVDCGTAWITYVNKGSVQNPKGITQMIWLESLVFEKKDDKWRAHFLHSTRIPQS
jgi:SnoaL-like domain